MNLETQISLRIAGTPRRDLPKHVYPKGKRGYLYFIRPGVCARMFAEFGTPDFADEYDDYMRAWGKPPKQEKPSKPPPRPTTPHGSRVRWRGWDDHGRGYQFSAASSWAR